MSRPARLALLAAAAVWAVVIVATAAHKSGDLPPQLAQSEYLLRGEPLYAEPLPLGTWWPPFTTVLLAPFALLARASMPLAKAAWAILGIACVAWSTIAIGRRWGWLAALIPLTVLARPIHNNFEHGQITAVLLVFLVGAIVDLETGRETRAGVWIGAATAAKAFPGLLLLYLALTSRWRALAAATIVTGVLTLGAMLPYGPVDSVTTAWRWLALSLEAPGTDGLAMQKLGRLVRDLSGTLAGPAPLAALAVVHVLLLGAVAVTLRRDTPPHGALYDVGVWSVLAVLLSPIGWFYYFGLLLPAGATMVRHLPPAPERRPWLLAAGIAAVLVSGLPRLIPFPAELAFVTRDNDTIGGLVLLAALLALRWRVPTLKGGPGGASP